MKKKTHAPWTDDEIDFLVENYTNMTIPEIRKHIRTHTPKGIYAKAIRLGLTPRMDMEYKKEIHPRHGFPYTPEEDDLIRKHSDLSLMELQENYLPERSVASIRVRAAKIGVTAPAWTTKQHNKRKATQYKTVNGRTKKVIPWTKEENEIIEKYKNKMTPKQIKERFFPTRTESSVRVKIHSNGHVLTRPCWSKEELALLREHAPAMSLSELAILLPQRTERAIKSMCHEIGIRKTSGSWTTPSPSRWTKKELKTLFKYYDVMTASELRQTFFPNRTESSIYSAYFSHKNRKDKEIKHDDEDTKAT